MKTELTIEQSQRLIELGVSVDKASSESMVGGSIFTLIDLLDILPKRIGKYRFLIEHNGVFYDVNYIDWGDDEDWEAVVRGYICDGFFAATELINALYKLVVWCIENKYIKQ